MARGTLSWNRGPTESRLVRTLAYLALGIPGGVIVALLVPVGPELVVAVTDGFELWFVGFLVVFAVVAAPILWASVRTRRAREERSRLAREWGSVGVRRGGVVSAILLGGLLLGVETAFGVGLLRHARAFLFGALLAGAGLGVAAVFLGSLGEVDPGDLTLSYGDREGIDLRYLVDARRLSVGQYTVFWLRFGPDVNHSRAQDLYAVPTEVADRAWPVFEKGIATEPPDGAGEKSALLRRVNVFVAFGFVAASAGVLALLVWFGAPTWELLQWLWITAGIAFFFLRFLVRTV